LKNGQAGAPATAAVAQGPIAPTTVSARVSMTVPPQALAMPTGVRTAAAASKGSTVPMARPAGALASAAKKGSPGGRWGRAAMVAPAVVPAGAPMAVAVAKGSVASATGQGGVLVPALKKGRPIRGWGYAAAGALAAATAAMMHSQEAAVVA
jgi:hypothetical protein